MSIKDQIEHKLNDELAPLYMEVVNESSNHNVPPGSETHFKVVLVSASFQGKPLVARHRMVNHILAAELAGGVHALSLKCSTPQQWEAAGHQISSQSPPCMHKK